MTAHPTYREKWLLPLLLICCGSLCHGRPENQEYVQSSSEILNHVSLTPATTSIHVSWNVNDPGDGVPREYRVRWQHQGVIRGNLYIDDATETTIYGLNPCTEYDLSVALIDVTGEPTGDAVHRTTTTINEAPPAVTGLQSQTSTPKVIILSWERPTTACEVTSYRVHFSGVAKWGSHAPHDDVKLISGEMADKTTRYELEGSLPHTDYSVSVVAYSAGGAGKKETTNFTTAEGEPSQPVNLRTTKPTANSITATWDEPVEKNGVLTHYHISWYSDDKLIGSEKERHTAHTIAGLSPCVEYKIRVAASTAGGIGDYREITQRTDAGAPSQPLDTSCSLNPDKTVSVTWAKPETSCPITGFKVSRPESSLEPNAMSTIDVPPSTLSANFSTVPGLKFRVCVSAVTSDAMIGPQSCCHPPAHPTPHPQAAKTTKQSAPGDSDVYQDQWEAAIPMIAISIVVGAVGITLFVGAVVGFVCWRRKCSHKQSPDNVTNDESQVVRFVPQNAQQMQALIDGKLILHGQ